MSRWRFSSIFSFGMAACFGLALPIQAQSQQAQSQQTRSSDVSCGLFPQPQRFNTQTSDDGVISVGKLPNRPYRLVLTRANDTELRTLRACVLDAFETRSRAGRYLLIGSFGGRREAERVRQTLRRAGYDARVVYLR